MNDNDIINYVRSNTFQKPVKLLYAYFPVVKKFVIKNSGSKQDAEDIFQDALIILFNKIKNDAFQLNSSLNTYIFGICKNLWLEQLRKNKKEMLSDTFVINDAQIIEEIQSDLEENQKNKKAFDALSQLGEKCRELLNLFYYKKLSMSEIASRLGFAGEKVAKNQKYRCIEKAKEIYLSIK